MLLQKNAKKIPNVGITPKNSGTLHIPAEEKLFAEDGFIRKKIAFSSVK